MRLDIYCAQFWPEQSRSTWQKLIKQGSVNVNGEVIDSPKYELNEDDRVEVSEPEHQDFSHNTLPIIYEDDNVIVIDKPIGVLTHAKGELNEEFTVAEFIRTRTTFGLDTNRPGIVHRLDRDTSGVIIAAKNPEAARLLSRQFQDRKAKKTYAAVLDGVPKEPKAYINLPIGRNPKSPSTFRVDPTGKTAETYYEIVQTDGQKSFVTLKPTTGRTHQLRVHMAYLNTPIRGDRVYGTAAERLYLHAHQLEVTIPGSERRTFISPIPKAFSEVLS
jgi:23S rRNA pseudouridine1911/1915/1917 synthase